MKDKEIQEQNKINLYLPNNKKVQKLREQGITLIALVVTIIIFLILAGVTLNMALSEGGLFGKAKLAAKKYDVASEQEVLQQKIIEYQMDNSLEKIGKQLLDKVNGVTKSDWKVIQLNNSDKNYGTNYYYIAKGTEIANYGQAKYNWVMNYETGEVINIEEYTMLDGNAGMSVTDSLALNINPVNLSDKNLWGENVKFVYGNEENSENSGVHGTELKFDGKDDYLRIDNVDIEKNNQLTFEFYGRYNDINIIPLVALDIDENEIPCRSRGFRTQVAVSKGFEACLGEGDSGSNLKNPNAVHWVEFGLESGKSYNNDVYFSLTINYSTGDILLFYLNERW